MEITFCDRCDASIPSADLDRGVARTRKGVLLCDRCLRRSGRFRAASVVLIPLALLSAAVLGAVIAILTLLPRIESLETDQGDLTTRVAEHAPAVPGEAILEEIKALRVADAQQSKAIGEIRETVVGSSRDLAAVAEAVRELSGHVVQLAGEIRAIKEHLTAENASPGAAPPAPAGGAPVDLATWLPRVDDPDPGVRLSALLALDPSEDERVATAAMAALVDADSLVRAEAARMLGNRREEKAVPGLIGLLSDRNIRVRAVAEKALVKIAGQDFGYDPTDPEEVRAKAIEKFREWSGE